MSTAPPTFPTSQRTTYQFPVYRWIGWLTVAGFALGLTAMFFFVVLFGVPAPLGWAFLVIVFAAGALLLDRPNLLLTLMIFYFLLMPSNRLLGLVGLPLPGFLDELFFLPFIAVIVMNWIQRRQLTEATLFPVVFIGIAFLSWIANGRPSVFSVVQVTLVMLKSYILWYFCRLTCTFENEKQLNRWVWFYIVYVAIQFLYNMLWQGGPWPHYHPDRSGGVFGPVGGGAAHQVGYLSVFALMLLTGWWVSSSNRASARQRLVVVLLTLVIAYNLIFMTDTKHALLMMPFAFLPFLFHPKFPTRLRVWLLLSGVVFGLATVIYFNIATGEVNVRRYFHGMRDSPKGNMFYAVTKDFRYLVRYPLLGAGPGRFASAQAVDARTPLARQYIIPYRDEIRRLDYFGKGLGGTRSSASVLGMPQSDFFTLMGEFGWLGAATYYSFLGWVIVRLWQKSAALPLRHPLSGLYMGVCCCVIFLTFVTLLVPAVTIPLLAFPLWMLIARMWDMPTGAMETADGG